METNIGLSSCADEIRKARISTRRDSSWSYYDSPLYKYEQDFSRALNGGRIRELLKGVSEPFVIDFLAPSGTIRDLFSKIPQRRTKGIAVSREDLRTEEEKAFDLAAGITQITGDLTKTKTWKDISTEANGRKANLIIERGGGGLYHMPKHPIFYGYALQRMWELLADTGTLLVQLPSVAVLEDMGIEKDEVIDCLVESGVEINAPYYTSNIAIRKKLTSPRVLPLKELPIHQAPDSHKSSIFNVTSSQLQEVRQRLEVVV